MKDKALKKIQRWKEKLLSNGGKEILIKVVAKVIPTYNMGYFKILFSLCYDLGQMMAKFWWWLIQTKGRFIGCLGINYDSQEVVEGGDSEIYRLSTSQCKQSKVGEF